MTIQSWQHRGWPLNRGRPRSKLSRMVIGQDGMGRIICRQDPVIDPWDRRGGRAPKTLIDGRNGEKPFKIRKARTESDERSDRKQFERRRSAGPSAPDRGATGASPEHAMIRQMAKP